MSSPRVRYSLQYVQYLYDSGEDRSMLEDLIRAFRGIQALPPDDHKSFFYLAGLHGLPFRGPGATDPNWWGGYCWHATVLFPTWHRIYVLSLENALRSIPGCQDVTLPFWDEIANLSGEPIPGDISINAIGLSVIPSVLTSRTFELDGRTDNPLYSYSLQKELVENVDGKNYRYSKPKGYQTVRYPLSGLVGTMQDMLETAVHNARFPDPVQNVQALNKNVTEWLLGTVKIPDDRHNTRQPDTFSVYARYLRSLCAPNYTVFSNIASQNQWIKDHGQDPARSHYVVSLESPHNAIHLSLGGFYQKGKYNASPVIGANGDMGDNETAGFDPIFFFHHCFIDYTFHVWQRLKGVTKRDSLSLIENYPGTVLQEGQPPNFPPGYQITLETHLVPYEKQPGVYYTSNDATDLEELGYAYGTGSLEPILSRAGVEGIGTSAYELIDSQFPTTLIAGSNPEEPNPFTLTKWVHKINRADYEGSFVVRLYAQKRDGSEEVEVGREAVLSRWSVSNCSNCQSHLGVELYVPIHPQTLDYFGEGDIKWRVAIQSRAELKKFTPVLQGAEHEGGRGEPQIDDL